MSIDIHKPQFARISSSVVEEIIEVRLEDWTATSTGASETEQVREGLQYLSLAAILTSRPSRAAVRQLVDRRVISATSVGSSVHTPVGAK